MRGQTTVFYCYHSKAPCDAKIETNIDGLMRLNQYEVQHVEEYKFKMILPLGVNIDTGILPVTHSPECNLITLEDAAKETMRLMIMDEPHHNSYYWLDLVPKKPGIVFLEIIIKLLGSLEPFINGDKLRTLIKNVHKAITTQNGTSFWGEVLTIKSMAFVYLYLKFLLGTNEKKEIFMKRHNTKYFDNKHGIRKYAPYFIFSTTWQLKLLSQSKVWVCEETQRFVPKGWKRTLIILSEHETVGFVPVSYIIVTSTKAIIYQSVFQDLKNLIEENAEQPVDFNGVTFVTDLNTKLIRGCQIVFPMITTFPHYPGLVAKLFRKAHKLARNYKLEGWSSAQTVGIAEMKILLHLEGAIRHDYYSYLQIKYREDIVISEVLEYLNKNILQSINPHLSIPEKQSLTGQLNIVLKTSTHTQQYLAKLDQKIKANRYKYFEFVEFLRQEEDLYSKLVSFELSDKQAKSLMIHNKLYPEIDNYDRYYQLTNLSAPADLFDVVSTDQDIVKLNEREFRIFQSNRIIGIIRLKL